MGVLIGVCLGLPAWAQNEPAATPPPGSQPPPQPQAGLVRVPEVRTPETELREQIFNLASLYWRGGALSYDQKVDIGYIWQDLDGSVGANGFPPLKDMQQALEKMRKIATPEQMRRAERSMAEQALRQQRGACEVFAMVIPDDVAARRDAAFAEASAEIARLAEAYGEESRKLRAQVAARLGIPLDQLGSLSEGMAKQVAEELRARELILGLEKDPYVGARFDLQWLDDPGMPPEKRRELANRMLARRLILRLGNRPLAGSIVAMQLDDEQRDKLERAWTDVCRRAQQDAAAGKLDVTAVDPIRDRLEKDLLDALPPQSFLRPDQLKILEIAQRVSAFSELWLPCRINDLTPEGVKRLGAAIHEFHELTQDIPQSSRGTNLIYQEARFDIRVAALLAAAESPLLPFEARVKPASEVLYLFPEIANMLKSALRLLDYWPVLTPAALGPGVNSPESVSDELNVRLLEIARRSEIWEPLREGYLVYRARMIVASSTDGRETDMYNRSITLTQEALHRFIRAIIADERFSPLQKMLFFENYWNGIGPYDAYFSALGMPFGPKVELLQPMGRALANLRSVAHYTQLVYSVEDIVGRLRTSVDGVHRTAMLSGLFNEEQTARLTERYRELTALLDEWGRYVPPDPNKPVRTAQSEEGEAPSPEPQTPPSE